MQEAVYNLPSTIPPTIKDEGSPIEPKAGKTSILENLPEYQPAIPLKKRNGPKIAPVFKTVEASPVCSGDPNNCRACANDPFGQAFCAALGDVVASSSRCTNCPAGGCDRSTARQEQEIPPMRINELVPRAEAWKQLKSHPNAPFADLRLLAEVVARRTGCSGPTIDLGSVATNGLDPGHLDENRDEGDSSETRSDDTPTRRPPLAEQDRNDPPSLVPQEILIRCGRGRALDVQAEGVREALRLLDSRGTRGFAHQGSTD
jgi:AP-1-like factor